MSCIWGMIFQWGSILKETSECLPHPDTVSTLDLTESLLKVMQNQNKTKLVQIFEILQCCDETAVIKNQWRMAKTLFLYIRYILFFKHLKFFKHFFFFFTKNISLL